MARPKLVDSGPSRGDSWAAQVRETYVLNESQDVLVGEIAATMDIIDGIAGDVVELRQQRQLLSRLLGQLGLPDSDDGNPTSTPSQRGRKAARARWDRQH